MHDWHEEAEVERQLKQGREQGSHFLLVELAKVVAGQLLAFKQLEL